MINEEIMHGKIYPWLTANDTFRSQILTMKDHLSRQKTTLETIAKDIEGVSEQDIDRKDQLIIKCFLCSEAIKLSLENLSDLDDVILIIRKCYSEIYEAFAKPKG